MFNLNFFVKTCINDFSKGEKIVNKTQVAKHLSETTGLKQQDCKDCISALCSLIKDGMKNGESITIKEFGSFGSKYRKEKYVYNLATQKPLLISARKVPVFKPMASLKKAINE